eukprot:605421-Amphidinium_carterae.1
MVEYMKRICAMGTELSMEESIATDKFSRRFELLSTLSSQLSRIAVFIIQWGFGRFLDFRPT